jgi:hypothetical protein
MRQPVNSARFYKKFTQDYTVRKSINFTNVHKENRTDPIGQAMFGILKTGMLATLIPNTAPRFCVPRMTWKKPTVCA